MGKTKPAASEVDVKAELEGRLPNPKQLSELDKLVQQYLYHFYGSGENNNIKRFTEFILRWNANQEGFLPQYKSVLSKFILSDPQAAEGTLLQAILNKDLNAVNLILRIPNIDINIMQWARVYNSDKNLTKGTFLTFAIYTGQVGLVQELLKNKNIKVLDFDKEIGEART